MGDQPGAGPAALLSAVEAAGVRDPRVLEALRSTPRQRFVPPEYAHAAYVDTPIPIRHDQVTSQPSLIAQMVAAVRAAGGDRVLEVGTGLGFQTALLGRLAGHVWSIERHADLAEEARANLEASGVDRVTVVIGDGSKGLADHAPYQGIVVSAASARVPPPLAEQLAEAGRLVQPITTGPGEDVVVFGKRGGRLIQEEILTPARFVPLHVEHIEHCGFD